MNQQTAPKSSKQGGGCFPSIFLFIGFGLLLVSALSILNTAFGWELSLSVYGADTELPKYWDATIGLSVVAVVWTAVGFFINSRGFLRFWGKNALNKVIVIGLTVGLLVGIFLILDDYDRRIKERNRELFAAMDSTETETEPEEDPEPYNPYADREVTIVVTNPSLDTLKAYANGEELLVASPREFGKGELAPGTHPIVAIAGEDTLLNYDLEVREGKKSDKNLIMVLNPDGFFNVAVLNFQDYYDDDNRKRKQAKTINYRLETYSEHESQFEVNVDGGSVLLPRRASIDISYGTALKFIAVPNQIGDNRDRAFDYAIWSFIDDEKKGLMQDGLDFFMLSDKKKREVVKNRLDEDFKRFEEEEPAN